MTRFGVRSILVVDDDAMVREAYRKVLEGTAVGDASIDAARAELFGAAETTAGGQGFAVSYASQGQEAAAIVAARVAAGTGFAVAFVDMRMPPGWDGLRTIEALWEMDPGLQVVLCTAYSDHSWATAIDRLGQTDRLLILKKPFDPIEVQQLAEALCSKRRLLDAHQRRAAELEALVAARTGELQAALEIAEAATRAKSEFLANMSHEIRTPMTAILGFTEVLAEPNLSVESRLEHVQVIRRNSEHLMAILNDILDLSKIEAGQMSVEQVPTHPPQILAEVASLMRVKAAAKDLQFEFGYDSDVPECITSDPTRLRQILLNLVANAIKFTAHGVVQLRAGTVDATGDHPVLQIAVRDTGIGITEEQRSRLFLSFSQADSTTTRRFGGTGLGLAISAQLAGLLGGHIEVRSAPQGGSIFLVTLPTGPLHGVTMVHDASVLPAGAVACASAEPMSCRILLVEDGRDNQRLIQTILGRVGAEVAIAEHGADGVQMALQSAIDGRPFDLVLMDMQMPVMDGYEATEQLRARGWCRPIVALTAHAMAGDRERCLAIGCDAYESKPIHREHLLGTLRRLLGRS